MNTAENTELLIEFQPADQATLEQLNETFSSEELLQSSSFDGTLLVTIITAATAALREAFKFYKVHKASLKSAKIRIKGKEVSLEGFSADEINEMAEKGTIRKIQENLK